MSNTGGGDEIAKLPPAYTPLNKFLQGANLGESPSSPVPAHNEKENDLETGTEKQKDLSANIASVAAVAASAAVSAVEKERQTQKEKKSTMLGFVILAIAVGLGFLGGVGVGRETKHCS